MKSIITGIIALVLTLGLTLPAHAATSGARGVKALRPVTLWLDWQPNSDHAGIYVALAKGYYARAGLDVRPQVPAGAADALKLVAQGTGDIAISYEPEVLLAQTRNIPVVATAAIVQRPLNCIMTLKHSGITRPRQLQGKTVGISALPSDYTTIDAMVRDDGGNPSRVKTINVGYGLLQQLLSGRVDAVEGVGWTWEALQARQQGYPVNVMRVDQYGVPTYDELVFATGTRQARGEAATLRAFQRATFAGYAYAAAHPAEAARILLKAPQVLSNSESLIERSIRLLSPVERDARGRYGTMSTAQWQAYADWMTRGHLVPTHINASTALTTSLLPKE
jgi:ABC-type nitrate/sulfonate/bicarbonate transport system substrate-binding protein